MELSDFELKTVTFGVNCAPYLAIRTLLQLATDVQNLYPLASEILKNSMYVDDVLAGFHNIETAIKSRDELIKALNSAGFSLRKSCSNEKEILENIPGDHLLDKEFLLFEGSSHAKALGIHWNACQDTFYFVAENFPIKDSFTKREVLSITAKLFDPAGWLAPILVVSKIIMQQVWLDKTGWDEPLLAPTLSKWLDFLTNYRHINKISIPRWTNYSNQVIVQIHGFSDASEKAYAGVVYIRVQTALKFYSSLIMAKTKVAPIKTISLPRLELCGALLLAEMLETILSEVKIKVDAVFCWTDSTIVLSWLQKSPSTWTTFAANRVSKIQDKVGSSVWRHVDTSNNPADLGSRGVSPQDLCQNQLWWQGPKWLQVEETQWPNFNTEYTVIDCEVRKLKSHTSTIESSEEVLGRFSSLSRALRVISYVFCFTRVSRKKETFNSLELSSEEITAVRIRLITLAQQMYFSDDFRNLVANKLLRAKSKIITLMPTCIVHIINIHTYYPVRVLLDPCSEKSKIANTLVDCLKLNSSKIEGSDFCEINLCSSYDHATRLYVKPKIVQEFNLKTPGRHINEAIASKFMNYKLGDPKFYISAAMVLGADVYSKILRPELLVNPGLPLAQNTIFGWVLSGPCVL